jgi:TonB family protein
MFPSILKRGLPFVLTFVVGATVGGLFKARRVETRMWEWPPHSTPLLGREGPFGDGHSCRAYRYRVPADWSPLVIISQPPATYTSMAKRQGLTGTVRLRVTFGADATVKDVSPLRVLPYGLTEAAESAAWRIRFTPATERGVPIAVTKVVEFDFPSEQTEDESSLPPPMGEVAAPPAPSGTR